MYIGIVLKEPIDMANPFDSPQHGFGQSVLRALDAVYTHHGKVFEGSIKDFIQMARGVAGESDARVMDGFNQLQKEDWLVVYHPTMIFRPTQKLCDRYIQI